MALAFLIPAVWTFGFLTPVNPFFYSFRLLRFLFGIKRQNETQENRQGLP